MNLIKIMVIIYFLPGTGTLPVTVISRVSIPFLTKSILTEISLINASSNSKASSLTLYRSLTYDLMILKAYCSICSLPLNCPHNHL
jgi:hypothetical protein